MTDRELLEWIKAQIDQYYIDVHKPAESPNLAEWTLLGIRNKMDIESLLNERNGDE